MNRYFEIFKHFLTLGCVSFGGPAAHIGYFHQKFVHQLQWLSQEKYGQIVALSQFLPGPGSSQVGFAVGYQKAGLSGALIAFVAFTTPSIILMLAIAQLSVQLLDNSYFYSITHGLKLLAVVVVADAVFSMFKSFCQSTLTRTIAVSSAVILHISASAFTQIAVILAAAMIGVNFLSSKELSSKALTNNENTSEKSAKPMISWWPLLLFVGIALSLILLSSHFFAWKTGEWKIASDFFQTGSLVFGGGHVVLPLLQNLLDGQLSTDTFLTGYAAAQAVPGPMFTLATFLGFHLSPHAPYLGALIATVSVFLPGFLLMLVFLKHWQSLASMPKLAGAIQAINAAVVGLLLSALYLPVFSSSVNSAPDMAVVLLGFYVLKQFNVPIVALVAGFAVSGIFLGWLN